mgnify:CR=1 FL=1
MKKKVGFKEDIKDILITEGNFQAINGVERKDFVNMKALIGDKSDNIPGCFPKCGAKTALKLAQDDSLLEAKFNQVAGSRERYQNNKLLIDFQCVILGQNLL